METKTNETKVLNDKFVAGEPFDYTKIHSDEYYEQYVQNFVPNNKNKWFYSLAKRGFDFFASLIALIVFIPFFIIIAIAIKCDSKGRVIFTQKRIGKNGKPFNCYKFRSMTVDAPNDCATSLLDHSEQYLTRVGKFLRRLSLDELPQLWCVLVGKMSIIGYRPLILSEAKCNAMREKLGVFKLKPGISGYAQVHGRDDLYYKNKAILDAEYVKKANLWFDLKLIFKTVLVVLKREGNDDK